MPSNLIPAMTDSIFGTFDPGIKDALIDVAEASLDCVLEDGFLKEVPILGTIASMCKAGVNMRERNLLRQTSAFVGGMRDGSISPEKRAEHKKALEDNPRQAEKEIGRILLLLDCTIEERQSEYLASFYKSFVRGALSWDKFCELSEANSRMFMDVYSLLNEVCDRPISQDAEVPYGMLLKLRRLESLGLVMENRNRMYGTSLVEVNSEKRFEATSLGKTFSTLAKAGRRYGV